jgi:predicted Rossmann fold flavoprotein
LKNSRLAVTGLKWNTMKRGYLSPDHNACETVGTGLKNHIAIIGGGAAGMMAAITAVVNDRRLGVVVLEKLDRPGKKLLATGNGRCNYTNRCISVDNYHGEHPEFIKNAIRRFGGTETTAFFKRLGVFPREEDDGKVFPYSGNASAVLDALRFELERLGVPIQTGFGVDNITSLGKDGFELRGADGRRMYAEKVIIAAGGKASPQHGTDGGGCRLLEKLGHRITPLSPALVQFRTPSQELRALKGIKSEAAVSLIRDGNKVETETGELLFASDGFSGPVVFKLSAAYAAKPCPVLSIDFCPEIETDALDTIIRGRATSLSHLTLENFWSGLINKRVGNILCRRAGIDKLSMPVSGLSDEMLGKMAVLVKDLRFEICGTNGWENAQVTAGGADTSEFNPDTMESLLIPGLYAAGEVLDIFGDCGGYNLQWAWSSGYAAGLAASGGVK